MMTRFQIRSRIVAAMLALAPAMACAFTLGEAEVLTRQGEPALLRVPLRVGPEDAGLRAAMAAESVYAALGYSFPQSLAKARVEVKEVDGRKVIEIAGYGPTKAVVLPIVLDVTTSQGSVVRHFTVAVPEARAAQGAAPLVAAPVTAQSARKAAVAPVAAGPNPVALADALIQQRLDQMKDQESDITTRIDALDKSIGSLDTSVKAMVASVTVSMEQSRVQQATLHQSLSQQLGERFQRDDALWFVAAAGIGFLLSLAIFGSKGRSLESGMRVRLVGHGPQPIEGEFVRMVTDTSKPLPYRIADRLAGVPRTLEFRVATDAPKETKAGTKTNRVAGSDPLELAGVTLSPTIMGLDTSHATAARH